MKKLAPILFLLLTLTGCGKKEIYGQILSIEMNETHTKLTFLGQDQTIFVDEKTHVYSFSDEIPYEKLLDGELQEPRIRAHDFSFRNGKHVADYICVESILLPDPYVLADGTELNIRKNHLHTAYETMDGIMLLWETDPVGPANVHGGGAPSLDTLNTKAQEAITAYYEEQGLLYDLDGELEAAWQAYLASENKPMFSCHHLSQDTFPSAANEKIIGFTTILALPIDGNHMKEYRYSQIFDRNTGKRIDIVDLFRCPEDQIATAILMAADLNDSDLFREITDHFRPEFLVFGPSALELWFPRNTTDGQEETHIICAEYKNLTDILYPWAIPDPIE